MSNSGKGLLLAAVCLFLCAQSAVQAEALSAKEVYLKYRSALAKAAKIEDLQSFMAKHVVDEIQQTPADMKPMMFGLMKETAPKTVEILSEEVKGDNALLKLSGKGDSLFKGATITKEDTKGSVKLLRENGEWKIDKESWESKIEAK